MSFYCDALETSLGSAPAGGLGFNAAGKTFTEKGV
jgi:hypothetical protein